MSPKASDDARRPRNVLSAKERQQYMDAIVEARMDYLDIPGPILVKDTDDDPAWLARREREQRQSLEPLSDDELCLEALQLSLRRREQIGPSPFGQTFRAVSRKGNKKSVLTRQQRKREVIERGRRELTKSPKLRGDQIYKLLNLAGAIKLSTFSRYYLAEIRK